MRLARHVIVRGRVQGVGYRAFVEDEAAGRGLAGWVRNRRDGSVEAVFAGEADAVEAAIAACRQGPYAARVDGVAIRDASAHEIAMCQLGVKFLVLPTV